MADAYEEFMRKNDAEAQLYMKDAEDALTKTAKLAEFAAKSPQILDCYAKRFDDETKLNDLDKKFLWAAVALQTARWMLIGYANEIATKKLNDIRLDHNDPKIKEWEKEWREKYKKYFDSDKHNSEKHRDYLNIVFDGVPYDVTKGCDTYGIYYSADNKIGGPYHRLHTLGHDPVLGWIFGVLNILTDTITLDKSHFFDSYNIIYRPKPKHWAQPGESKPGKTNMGIIICDAYDAVLEDWRRLPAAVFAQGLHLGSDAFTKLGLPVPFLETFAPELASKLYKNGYDSLFLVKDIAVVGTQYLVAKLIDWIIMSIHSMYYNPAVDTNEDFYAIRTSKILKYSNIISSSSNVLAVSIGTYLGKADSIRYIDFGGFFNCIQNIVEDYQLQNRIKMEFVLGKYHEKLDNI